MSNFKKFLALVLATLMVASAMVFTAPAAAAAEYAPTGDYADDIALLSAFGVMLGDGTSYQEKENVTRWQMALLIARIVTGETGNDMWEAEKSEFFTDVTADHYPGAIDFCAEMGYIKGVGDNKFEPDENISYQDGLTMLVRLLGYETENMTYPWGYILSARTIQTTKKDSNGNPILLVSGINTSNKTPLLREEVASLLAKAIYVNLKVDGKETASTLVATGLKAEDLGSAKLVATWNASINGAAFSGKYDEVTFLVGETRKNVKISKISNAVLDFNDYLGFTADIVNVKGTLLATMSNIKVVDANVIDTNKIKADGKEFTSFLVYGSNTHNVFVNNAGTVAKGTNGKVIICDVDNDGTETTDIIRFVPYNDVRAIYPIEVSVTKADNAWKATETITVYYVGKYDTDPSNTTPDQVRVVAYPYNGSNHEEAKMYGLGDAGLSGLLHADGISNNGAKTDLDVRTTISKDGWNRRDTTSYNISVIGDIAYGEPMVCSIVKIASDELKSGSETDLDTDKNLVFVTSGKNVEIESGRGTITELNSTDVKIGDTYIPAGFNLANKKIENSTANTSTVAPKYHDNWFYTFTEAEALITDVANKDTDAYAPLLGKEVEYTKVDGKIVALKLYVETETPDTVYLTNPNTATPLFVNFTEDTELKVAADGTIEIEIFDAKTFALSTIKIDQINGHKLGTLVNQFGFPVAKGIVGYNSADNLTELVIMMLVDGNNFVFDYTETDAENALVLATVANKADDVYAITTEKNANVEKVILGTQIYKSDDGKKVISGVDTDGTKTLGFVKYTDSALSDQPFYVGTFDDKVVKTASANYKYTYAAKYLTITDKTVINVIAADGVKSFKNITVTEGDLLKLADSGNAFVLNLTNDLVVIVNNDSNLADIARFGSNVTVPTTGGWYTLTWTSQYVTTTAETVNGTTFFNYTFKDLYNLTTGALEPVTISSTEYYPASGDFADSPAAKFFGNSWNGNKATGPNIDKTDKAFFKDGSIIDTASVWSDMYDVYYISNAKGSEVVNSSIISWGLANGYSFAQVQTGGIISGDNNTFKADILKVECNTNGTYSFTKTGELTSVVAIHSTVLNQSKDSTADEFKVTTTPGAHAAKLATQKEIVAYKLGADGVITVFGITADDYKNINIATTGIADALAKVAE